MKPACSLPVVLNEYEKNNGYLRGAKWEFNNRTKFFEIEAGISTIPTLATNTYLPISTILLVVLIRHVTIHEFNKSPSRTASHYHSR